MTATLRSYTECPAKYKYARWLKGQCYSLSLPEDGIGVVVEDGVECIRSEITGDADTVERLRKIIVGRIEEIRKDMQKEAKK